MDIESLIELPPSSTSGNGSEDNDPDRSERETSEANSGLGTSKAEEDKLNGDIQENNDCTVANKDGLFQATNNDNIVKDLVDSTAILQVSAKLTETIAVAEELKSQPNISEAKESKTNEGAVNKDENLLALVSDEIKENLVDGTAILQVSAELVETNTVKENRDCTVHSENGGLIVQDGSPLGNHKRVGSPISGQEIGGSSISGVKKPRMTVDEQQPSVHVVYNSLTRGSKRKLEELLQQWSEWHARHHSSSHDSNKVVESGEETYFPALHVGLDKRSAVSFWMDKQTRNLQNDESSPLDGNLVPLYDRGYSWGLTSTDGLNNRDGGMEIVDAPRCFNCGSYNHALKECPKPRDNAAVNNARKQHKSKRNLSTSSRNPTRYYQNTPGGKYDGLRPGVLDLETRQLLGIGELDPPPWLNRMREIGYPPGYLDPEEEDEPSGITIFTDEEIKEDTEDGEILDTDHPDLSGKSSVEFPGINGQMPEIAIERRWKEPPRKRSVEFPGINGPIPENADERRWADPSRIQSHRRYDHSSESLRKEHYHEERWSRDYRDDGPPGCDPGTSPSMSTYSPRYGSHDPSYISYSPRESIPRENIPIPGSPSFGRSFSDRSRRSPLVHGSSINHGSYWSSPSSPPDRLLSPHSYGSAGLENRSSDRRKRSRP